MGADRLGRGKSNIIAQVYGLMYIIPIQGILRLTVWSSVGSTEVIHRFEPAICSLSVFLTSRILESPSGWSKWLQRTRMRGRKRNPARSTCNVLHFKEKYPWQSRHHVPSCINGQITVTGDLGQPKKRSLPVGFITRAFSFISCGCDKIPRQKQLQSDRVYVAHNSRL